MGAPEQNKTTKAIRLAYEKGYRVKDKGIVLNPKGEKMNIRKFDKYPKFTVHGANFGKYRHFSVPVHRFAAYCFFGEEIFEDGVVVRHLNDDKSDYKRSNLALGSLSDNMNDIPKDLVKARLDYARSFQGPSPKRMLSDEDVRAIRRRIAKGEMNVSIAADYGVVPTVISSIKYKRSYKDVI